MVVELRDWRIRQRPRDRLAQVTDGYGMYCMDGERGSWRQGGWVPGERDGPGKDACSRLVSAQTKCKAESKEARPRESKAKQKKKKKKSTEQKQRSAEQYRERMEIISLDMLKVAP